MYSNEYSYISLFVTVYAILTYIHSGLGNALISVFQILTFDHWYAILTDIAKVCGYYAAVPYFITWIWLGAFVFRNVFIGVMGMFQIYAHVCLRS